MGHGKFKIELEMIEIADDIGLEDLTAIPVNPLT